MKIQKGIRNNLDGFNGPKDRFEKLVKKSTKDDEMNGQRAEKNRWTKIDFQVTKYDQRDPE